MSFDHAYPNRKDWRRPYRGSKRFDSTCRNHGACSYCVGNRLHKHRRREPIEEFPEYVETPWEDLDDAERSRLSQAYEVWRRADLFGQLTRRVWRSGTIRFNDDPGGVQS